MLMVKKFPTKVRAFRFVVLELLRGFVGEIVEKQSLSEKKFLGGTLG